MNSKYSSLQSPEHSGTISIDNAVIQNLYPGFFFPTHFHQTVELVACISGQVTLNIQNEDVVANKGEYIVCFPNFPHSTANKGKDACAMLQLHFHVQATVLQENDGVQHPSPFNFEVLLGERRYLKRTCSPQMTACIRGIYEECLDKRLDYANMLFHYACQLDTLLSRDMEAVRNSDSKSMNGYLLLACSYIKDHYAERLTIDSIAGACNISARYLSKLFRDYLQLSVCSYITHVRINKSIEIMRSKPDYPLVNLAMDLGFSSQQHFSAVFKETMSMSPKRYFSLHHENI